MASIKTITVVKGDTLSQLALDNNTTVADILKLNSDIKDPNLILVGQKINVEEMDFGDDVADSTPAPNINSVDDYNRFKGNDSSISSIDTSEDVQSDPSSYYDGSYRDDSDVQRKETIIDQVSETPEDKVENQSYEEDLSSSETSTDDSLVIGGVTVDEQPEESEEDVPEGLYYEDDDAEEAADGDLAIDDMDTTEEDIDDEDIDDEDDDAEEAANEDLVIDDMDITEEDIDDEEEIDDEDIDNDEDEEIDSVKTENVDPGYRDLDAIAAEVDRFGGNNGHSIYDDARNSGNEEYYI